MNCLAADPFKTSEARDARSRWGAGADGARSARCTATDTNDAATPPTSEEAWRMRTA